MRTSLTLGLAAALAAASPAQLVFLPNAPLPPTGAFVTFRLAAGDLDADGHDDVLVSGNGVQLLRGVGDGSFAPPVAVLPDAPLDMRLADLDGDGALDLLGTFPDGDEPRFVTHLGNGDGTFGPALPSTIEGDSFVVGLINDDAIPDAVLRLVTLPFFQSVAIVLHGVGDGTFTPVHALGTSSAGGGTVLGDIDGDGLVDLVMGPTLTAYLGLPGGTFGVAQPLAPEMSSTGLAIADLDLDGDLDLVLANAPANQVRILKNSGKGSFYQRAVYDFTAASTVVVAALDDDEWIDLAVHGLDGAVHVLNGQRGGTFTPTATISGISGVTGTSSGPIAIDADEDGRLDLLVEGFTPGLTLNRTYASDAPFLDLGFAHPGGGGYPVQVADGTLVAGQPFSFLLGNGVPGGNAFHVVGLSELYLPFKGGTLVPAPTLVNGPLPLDAQGDLLLLGTWPDGGSGAQIALQFLIPDAGASKGFALTSAVRASVP